MSQSRPDRGREYVPLRTKGLPSFGDVKALPEGTAWQALNFGLSCLILFGGLGFLADRLLHTSWLVVVGIIAGMAFAGWVGWFRYGMGRRPEPPGETGSDAVPGGRVDSMKVDSSRGGSPTPTQSNGQTMEGHR